ncbi:MAG TPA: transcriptional repressor LexA [Blastocatellia bacterium]|jgi:repressor LexA
MAISPRQREVFDYLSRFVGKYSQAPTIAEIQAHFGLNSPSTVHSLLSALEREGLIRRTPNVSRGIEITGSDTSSNECEIPLLGIIAAGHPIEAILSQESICIPRDMLGKGRTFALRVRGDSMVGEGILDGDSVIVESRQMAQNGQTVVALVDGSDATVKQFYKERGRVRLEAANPRYKPIIIKPPDRVDIQGIVIGVLRRYKS